MPIILLHDSLGCVDLWREWPRLLCERLGRVVVAYDRLGFGRSDARVALPSVHFIEEESEVYLPAVLRALAIEEFDLFGHSVGGGMALTAGPRLPGLRRIVSESAQAFVEEKTLAGLRAAQATFAEPKKFARLTRYHGEKAAWVLRAWTEVWLSPQFANWTLAPVLPLVKQPVLAIHGDADDFGSRAFPELIAGLAGGPAEMVLVPDCGHVPHREKSDIILSLCQKFYG